MPFQLEPLTPEREKELIESPAFKHLLVKEYSHWSLYLSDNQSHLGRAYAWLTTRHVDVHPLYDLLPRENSELQWIMKEHRRATATIIGYPDLVNYEWLGNEFDKHRGHGHMHFIPRYSNWVKFKERLHVDVNFGKRSKYEKLVLPELEMKKLVGAYRTELT
ncbi:MAG: hypothetical protein ABA06_03130 [Parcubacteria bacterium C7867-001]|nr:MAG: hypothetical protein ABA06_03130 [Parcubacteria bacterium C7867-001]